MEKASEKANKVDIVITWVDGNDPKWLSEKRKYSKQAQNASDHEKWADSEMRFRDWGTLKYIFRGIEKYCNWYNKIYFVTWGHVPNWLNTNNPRLVIIKHEDFIPKKYLPTFNSNAIELNFHRIDSLSESFVYFNDDMYVIRKTKKRDFNIPFATLAKIHSTIRNTSTITATKKVFQ